MVRRSQLAAIFNAAYLVRHYSRPGQIEQRARALVELGRACRAAFNASEDFEPVLRAILEALAPPEQHPF